MSVVFCLVVIVLSMLGCYFIGTKIAAAPKWFHEKYERDCWAYDMTDNLRRQYSDLKHRVRMIEDKIGKEES